MKERLRSIRKRQHQTIYLLPNIITTLSLFFGFFAIIRAIRGDYSYAAYAILVAAVFDLLDGRIARITRSTSTFGTHYDSLCDAISFGMAPSLLLYFWSLQPFGRIGWLTSFFYLACGVLRLARFNTNSSSQQDYFVGLPIPMAAGIVASGVLSFNEMGWIAYKAPLLLLLTTLVGFMMVTNFPYRSFKDVDFRKKLPFPYLVLSIFLVAVIAIKPEVTLFVLFLSYVLLGFIFGVINWSQRNL